MDNEKVFKMMDEIIAFIPNVFEDNKKLKKHLSFMRYFSDIEWFNMLAILYQSPDATVVRTTTAWSRVFNKEVFPKRGERGIQIFLPICRSDCIDWKVVKVFDISQIQTAIHPKYASYLQMAINTIGIKYLERGEEGWQNQLILNTMKKQKVYSILTKTELKFTMNCILTTCGDLLGISIDELDNLTLTCPDVTDYMVLYKFIKDIIASLPEQLLDYISVIDARERLHKDIEEAIYISQMNIKQNIRYAQKIYNHRLQLITDGGNDRDESDSGIGIPLNDVVQDEDIFKGDV